MVSSNIPQNLTKTELIKDFKETLLEVYKTQIAIACPPELLKKLEQLETEITNRICH